MTRTPHIAASITASLCVLVSALACSTAPALATEPQAPCPNEQLRGEQPFASGLPDCRAYEMVSPLGKDDNGVVPVDARAAVSGEAVTYVSPGAFAEPKSAVLEGRYISRRAGGGWSTANISPPYTDYHTHALSPPFGEDLFTPDLSSGTLESFYTPLVEGEPAGYVNLYVAGTEDGSYRVVSRFTPEEGGPFEYVSKHEPQVEGGSVDLSRVVFQEHRKQGASGVLEHVYESAGGGQPVQVDVAPEGVMFEGESNVGAAANGNLPAAEGDAWHAVSSDGSRVFFTPQERVAVEDLGQLFVRVNIGMPQSPYAGGRCAVAVDACTVEVSASQRRNAKEELEADPHGPQPAFYRDASVDGSLVFFTSRAELTSDAFTGPADNAANLYEYDVETGVLTDLTVDHALGDPNGAAVLGLMTAGEDGSYVYFVANGVLAAGAKPGNCREEDREAAVAGERSCSLYVEHLGAGGWEPPRFIATLAGSNADTFGYIVGDGDETDWVGYEESGAVLDFGPGQHTARVSGGGSRLVFESELSLTGFDNVPVGPGACGEHDRCREVYLFDAESGSLVCVSCDPGGGRPVGPAELGGHEEFAGSLAGVPSSLYLPRNLSEDGARLFFQSPDPLVAHDGNGLLDVYEWEQPASPSEAARGENSCTAASSDYRAEQGGCVFPISNVAGGNESYFMDASANGDDAFIATADQLLPSDTDTRVDVYDVRVGGGFSVTTAAPVCVNADSCKPPASPQPGVFGAPASTTFTGLGNPAPMSPQAVVKPKAKTVKCAKSRKLSHDKCVPKKRKKAKKQSRNRRKK